MKKLSYFKRVAMAYSVLFVLIGTDNLLYSHPTLNASLTDAPSPETMDLLKFILPILAPMVHDWVNRIIDRKKTKQNGTPKK